MKRCMAILVMTTAIAGLSWADMTNTLPISVTIVDGAESFISIAPSTMSFDASVHPDSFFRFNSGIFTCTFFSAYSPWSVRMYHTNGTQAGRGALKHTSANRWLMTRVWQPNYGSHPNFGYYGKPTNFYDLGYLPDPMMVSTTGYARVIPNVTAAAVNMASSGDGDASPVRFNFVVMDTNRVAGTYSGNIFFELIVP